MSRKTIWERGIIFHVTEWKTAHVDGYENEDNWKLLEMERLF